MAFFIRASSGDFGDPYGDIARPETRIGPNFGASNFNEMEIDGGFGAYQFTQYPGSGPALSPYASAELPMGRVGNGSARPTAREYGSKCAGLR